MSVLITTQALCQLSLLHKFYVSSYYYTNSMSVLIIHKLYVSSHYTQVPYQFSLYTSSMYNEN